MVRDTILDEAVRDELDTLGLKHFLDVRATVRCLLEGLQRRPRAAFAAAVADRLLDEHEGLPGREQAAEVLQWRPTLEAVWQGLQHRDDADDLRQVAQAVGSFYLSPAYLDHGHDDPHDRNDDTTMAALYAAECFLHGCLDFATWAGWRGFDAAAVRAAEDREWAHRRPTYTSVRAWELAHPAIQAELDQQLADVEQLSAEGSSLDDGPAPGTLIGALRRHSREPG
jgi:hypothetical protein